MNQPWPSFTLHLSMIILSLTFTMSNGHQCPRDCFSHIYSLSNDPGVSCTHREHCLMRSRITVIQQGSMDEMLNITLVGYGLHAFDDRTLAIRFESDLNTIEYGCSAPRYGRPKITITQGDGYPYHIGNIFNSTGKLYCNWVFSKDSVFWPKRRNGSLVDFINERNWRISLVSNNHSKVVAWDLSRFPLFKMNFLRCCYPHHGSHNYLVITNQTASSTNFYVQAFQPIPQTMTIRFENLRGHMFMIVCGRNFFNATVSIGGQYSPIRDILYAEPYRIEEPFHDFRCSWSQPIILNERAGSLDTSNGQFNLEISADNRPPYREPLIDLRGGSITMTVSLVSLMLPLLMFYVL
ncbi:uncharacterized protein LOC141849565 [Brevipalpus obovatus]|uniref:uncharacterized protein LOC141849565 n=1 Tax=Brevipalpus obovatus TaxID=246614 RepID=UPI003D9DCC62